MATNVVSIEKVVRNALGEKRALKYFGNKASLNRVLSANALYQEALGAFSNGNNEAALKYIISGLEFERDNTQFLHLCKTLMVSFSEYMFKKDAREYRKKYKELYKAVDALNESLDELKDSINRDSSKVKKLKADLENSKPTFMGTKLFIVYFFKKKKLSKQIEVLEKRVKANNLESLELQEEIGALAPIAKIEELAKVVSLIIEVCTFPSHFVGKKN